MQNIKNGTTIHLTMPRRLTIPTPIAAAICVIALAGIIAAVGRISTTPAAPAAMATPALPIIIIASPVPLAAAPAVQQVVAQQPAAPAVVRWVTAFAAPDGVALGPIPMPEAGALTGRYGDGWVSTAWQNGTVWLRVAELGASLANIEPAIAPVQPAQQPETGHEYPAAPILAPQLDYQVSNQPPAQQPEAQPAPTAAPQAQPTAAPQPTPRTVISVDGIWAAEQWRAEHCVADRCIP